MAVRPVFIPTREGEALVDIVNVDFSWSPGLAVSQKQKSIAALHDGYAQMSPGAKILEVSSKSPDALGVQLSALSAWNRCSSLRKCLPIAERYAGPFAS
jgi:hypothetical protein